MQRALITGITGFVGGHLAEHLLAQGDRVLGCAESPDWPEASPSDIAAAVPLLKMDLAEARPLSDACFRQIAAFAPTVIYHLAAISNPADCGSDEPTPLAQTVNVEGTRFVLQLATRLGRPPRVVLISTSHVYDPGFHREGVVPPTEDGAEPIGYRRLREDAPIGPWRGYGRSKWSAEQAARQAIEKNDVDAVIVRAFQHAGPRQTLRMMLPDWIRQLRDRGASSVSVQTLDAWIDLTDVRDVVRAYRLIAERAASGDTLNVGSSICRRTGDLFRLLQAMAGDERPVVEQSPGFKLDPIADISHLRQVTGWRPERAVEETLGDAWRWWMSRRKS